MARPSKLTKALQTKLMKAIAAGATVKDACDFVGIGEATFYEWNAIGNAVLDDTDHERMPKDDKAKQSFAEFAEALTRAQGTAKVVAIQSIRNAMVPYSEKSVTKETFTETKMNAYGAPYEYKRETVRETVTHYAGDWKAAVEYLKRRHNKEWGDKQDVTSNGETLSWADAIRKAREDIDG